MPTNDWICEAYGPDLVAIGVVCFFAEPGERACQAQFECVDRLAGERRRVYRRINELAAAGDEVSTFLAEEITHPEQLLGKQDGPADGDREG